MGIVSHAVSLVNRGVDYAEKNETFPMQGKVNWVVCDQRQI